MNTDLPVELQKADLRLRTATVRPPRPLIRKEGWRDHMNQRPPQAPERVSPEVLEKWSKSHSLQYRAIRKRYHVSMEALATPALTAITESVVRMALSGLDMSPGVRPGALVNGQPTLGKSTILVEIGRQYERRLRLRCGLPEDADLDVEFIPVLYTTLSSEETSKGLSMKMLDFYGTPYSPNWNEKVLSGRVADQAARYGTSLILIDDIHFLNARVAQGAAVNTHLKALMSMVNATFVYAGVHIESTGLLFEGRLEAEAQAAQTQRRFKRLDMEPFSDGDPALEGVLSALEEQLVLLKSRPGDLTGLASYIHGRTDGYMGPIASLVREGAALAMDDGSERITKALLDRVVLDHASQRRFEALNAPA